jgi:cytochrome c
LNGKILRIKPQTDGTYTLPTGNLFSASMTTRGEIYAMGMRNPIRIAIDSKTGWVYWGEPGPDAQVENASRGPVGRDEFNQAKAPGFFGWPYFVGENLAYTVDGAKKSVTAPINRSPNNTGDSLLPAAQPAWLSYPDQAHPDYSALEANDARAAIIGGVYRFNPALGSQNRLPPRFDGSVFIMDWSRDWVNEVRLTTEGNIASIAPFIKNQRPNGPIDMAFGPQGDLFLLEYDSHALYQVKYTGTCKMEPVSIKPHSPSSEPATGHKGPGRLGNQRGIPLEALVGRMPLPNAHSTP